MSYLNIHEWHMYEPEGRQGKPEQKDKLEGVVEGEPVDNADKALNDAGRMLEVNRAREPMRKGGAHT